MVSSDMASFVSSSSLANKPGARTLRNVSNLSQELREALRVHAFCRVRLRPELLGAAVVLTTQIAVTAALALSLASSLVSLVHQLIKASDCLLHFLQPGRLPHELSGDPHEFSLHPANSNRKVVD